MKYQDQRLTHSILDTGCESIQFVQGKNSKLGFQNDKIKIRNVISAIQKKHNISQDESKNLEQMVDLSVKLYDRI